MATTPPGNPERAKLALAIVALLVAGTVLAWNFGAFDTWLRPAPIDPMAGLSKEEQEEVKAQEKRDQERAKETPPS